MLWSVSNIYDRHPLPEDVLLLIEVADSTIADDLGTKQELYAEDGIVEYWVVNIPAKAVHVYRQPGKGDYVDVQVLTAEDELRPRDFPDVMITPNRIFDY